MADGTTKPIGDVKVGDQVLATDPGIGKVEKEKVTQLHDNVDADMADLIVADDRGHKDTIHTTQNHSFWDATTRDWTRTDQLRRGDHLLSPAGAQVLHVVNVRAFTRERHMRNLTVAHIHTYHVVVGDSAVLVHNDACRTLPSSNSSDALVVIGKRNNGDTGTAIGWPGHEVLDLRSWSQGQNDEWVRGAAAKKQRVYLASSPSVENLFVGGDPDGARTIFGVEYEQFLNAGYTPDGDYLNPPVS
jgi:hypothetical protein